MARASYDHLDELLVRIHVARQRPGWRRRLLDTSGPVTSVSTLRILRAVERAADSEVSVRDVAEYLGVEHSTASRSVAAAVASGLLRKTSGTHDQRRCVLALTDLGNDALNTVTQRRRDVLADSIADWPDADVEHLVELLDRLTQRFESYAGDE